MPNEISEHALRHVHGTRRLLTSSAKAIRTKTVSAGRTRTYFLRTTLRNPAAPKRHYLRQAGYAQRQPHRGPVLSPYSMRNSDFGCAANQDTDKRTSHRLCVLQVWRAFDFRQPRRVLGRKSRLPHARLPYADYSDREFFPHTACLSAEDIRIKSAGLPPPFVTKNHEDKQHVIPLPKKIDAYRLVFRY